MTEKLIAALEARGFRRWQKNDLDRLYVNASVLGLECSYYKTGNISGATLNGERISNSRAYGMKAAKVYIDVKTGVLYSDNYTLQSLAQDLYDSALAESEEMTVKEASL